MGYFLDIAKSGKSNEYRNQLQNIRKISKENEKKQERNQISARTYTPQQQAQRAKRFSQNNPSSKDFVSGAIETKNPITTEQRDNFINNFKMPEYNSGKQIPDNAVVKANPILIQNPYSKEEMFRNGQSQVVAPNTKFTETKGAPLYKYITAPFESAAYGAYKESSDLVSAVDKMTSDSDFLEKRTKIYKFLEENPDLYNKYFKNQKSGLGAYVTKTSKQQADNLKAFINDVRVPEEIKNLGDDVIAHSLENYRIQRENNQRINDMDEKYKDLNQTYYENAKMVGENVGRMAMDTMISNAAGGILGSAVGKFADKATKIFELNKATKTASKIVKALTPTGTTALMGITAASNKIDENLSNGVPVDLAVKNGLVNGYMQAITEKIGFEGIPGVSKVIDNVASGSFIKTLARTLMSYSVSSFGEGAEEVVQNILGGLIDKAIINPNISFKDIMNPKTNFEAFAGGALVGGVLGAIGLTRSLSAIKTTTDNVKIKISYLNAVNETLADEYRMKNLPINSSIDKVNEYSEKLKENAVKQAEAVTMTEKTPIESAILKSQNGDILTPKEVNDIILSEKGKGAFYDATGIRLGDNVNENRAIVNSYIKEQQKRVAEQSKIEPQRAETDLTSNNTTETENAPQGKLEFVQGSKGTNGYKYSSENSDYLKSQVTNYANQLEEFSIQNNDAESLNEARKLKRTAKMIEENKSILDKLSEKFDVNILASGKAQFIPAKNGKKAQLFLSGNYTIPHEVAHAVTNYFVEENSKEYNGLFNKVVDSTIFKDYVADEEFIESFRTAVTDALSEKGLSEQEIAEETQRLMQGRSVDEFKEILRVAYGEFNKNEIKSDADLEKIVNDELFSYAMQAIADTDADTLNRMFKDEDKGKIAKFIQFIRDIWNDIVKSFRGEAARDISEQRFARQMADKFNKLYNDMTKVGNTINSNDDGTRYSISYTTDNTPVVVVNDDITRYASNDKDLISLVKKSLVRFKKVPIKGQTIKFLYDTKNEYTHSGYTNYLRYSNNEVYKDKMRLSAHPQEIIYATTDYINEGLKHPRKDKIVDFSRGNLLFDISGRKYSAEVVIGFTNKGVCELHDIVNINDTNFNYKKIDASNTVGLNNKPVRKDASTNNNVPQPDTIVNTYSMQNSKNNAENNSNDEGTRGNLQSDYTAERITSDMTDSERTEIIKNKVIVAPIYDGQADTIINENSTDLESGKKQLIQSALLKIGKEFGIKGNYNINDGKYEIFVSNKSINESVTKVTNPKQLAKLFPRLNEALTNAIGIETHKNRYYYDDSTLEVHEFLSGYIEGDYFIPIRFGIKNTNFGFGLYVMIDGEKIKKSEVVETEPQNKSGDFASRSDNISLSLLIPKVNSKDIIKYLPDNMLTENQLEIKIKALEETQKYSDGKNNSKYIKYINEGKLYEAKNMLKKLASDKGYVKKDGRYINENGSNKSADVTYDDNGNVIPFSQRYDNTNSDTRYNIQSDNDVDTEDNVLYNKSKLSKNEWREFYSALGELKRGMWFPMTSKGSYIFDVGEKLVYTNGDYQSPHISEIISFEGLNDMEMEYGKEVICNNAKRGKSSKECCEIAQSMLGKGVISRTDTYTGKTHRRSTVNSRQGENSSKTNIGSREDVKIKENEGTRHNAQSEDEFDKLAKEEAIPKGEKPARDITVPARDKNGKKVSRFGRTLLEASVFPDEQTNEYKRLIVEGRMSHEVLTDKKAKQWAEEKIERNGWGKSLDYFNEAVDDGMFSKNLVALGQTLLNGAYTDKDFKTAENIALRLSEVATNAGQTVQAQRMLKKMSPEGKMLFFDRYVSRIKKEKGIDIKIDEKLKEKYLKNGSSEVEDEIIKNIADQLPSTIGDKWNEWRYLSMLGNAKTHIRNILGNVSMYVISAEKNAIGSIIEKSIPKDQRTKSLIITKEQKAFAAEDFEKIKNTLDGGSKYSEEDRIERQKKVFKNRMFEWLRTFNSDMLEKEDGIFTRWNYIRAFSQIMQARGITPKMLKSDSKGNNSLLEEIRSIAIKQAQANTFRDYNCIAGAISRLQRKLDNSGTLSGKAASFVIEGTIPFKKTPLNVAKQGINYSPLGLAKGIYEMCSDVKKGNKTASEAIDTLASGLTGTGLVALGFLLSSLGVLKQLPDDEKERNLEKNENIQDISLYIGGISYTLDWLSPTMMPMAIGMNAYKLLNEKSVNPSQAFVNAIEKITKPLFDMSCLQGINNTLETISNKKGSAMINIVTDALISYVSQAFPTISGQVARIIDPYARKTYTDKNLPLPEVFQMALQKIAKKIPGASMYLPKSIDMWGEEIKQNDNIPLRAFENLFSPGYIGIKKNDNINEELKRLADVTGETAQIPPTPRHSITSNKKVINMTENQYTEYVRYFGKQSKLIVSEIIKHPYYKKLSDDEKVYAISKVYLQKGAEAKNKVLGIELPDSKRFVKYSAPKRQAEYFMGMLKIGEETIDGVKEKIWKEQD